MQLSKGNQVNIPELILINLGNQNGNVNESGDISESPEESSLFSLTSTNNF